MGENENIFENKKEKEKEENEENESIKDNDSDDNNNEISDSSEESEPELNKLDERLHHPPPNIEKELLNSVNELFESKILKENDDDIQYKNIIKLCFCSLIVFNEIDIMYLPPSSTPTTNKAITYTRFSSILTNAIGMLWMNLLGINNSSNSTSKEWELFISKKERDDFLKFVRIQMDNEKKELELKNTTYYQSIRKNYKDKMQRYRQNIRYAKSYLTSTSVNNTIERNNVYSTATTTAASAGLQDDDMTTTTNSSTTGNESLEDSKVDENNKN